MTISSSVSKATLNGDGVQTEFPFAFKVWKAGDLEVSITSPAGANTVVGDWTVELAGIGGTVTYPTAGDPLPLGWMITIRRLMDFLQDVDLVSGTRFDPEVIETALDIATAERQQLLEEISRAVRVGVASEEDPTTVVNQVFEARDDAAASAIKAQAAQLAAEAISTEAAARAYNYIINGNFDIWQRGTSQTSGGYGSDDRWFNHNQFTTKTHSRQSFAVGDTFPDGNPAPKYYSRTVVSSVTGPSNTCVKQAKLEDVTLLAGRKVTLAFYARADASKNITIEFSQSLGTGGSPSLGIVAIKVEKISLSTTFQRFVITCDIPSVAGKILGTDNNSYTQVNFWFDAGSSFDTRTDSLGHQSGTFDIACVSLVKGDVDIKPIPRSIGEELELCMRFYQTGYASLHTEAPYANAMYSTGFSLSVPMRAQGVLQLSAGYRANVIAVDVYQHGRNNAKIQITSGAPGYAYADREFYKIDAEL